MSYISWHDAVQWLRDQPDRQELVKACYFDDPLEDAAARFAESAEWKAICNLLPARKGTALDLGAGRGISSYALALGGWQVTALEPDPSGLVGAGAIRDLCQKSGIPITIVSDYSESLPFDDNSFDLVNCRQALHHARDLRRTCLEIRRVLKPGGRIVATREHVISKKEDLSAFLNSHILHRFYGGENAYLLAEYTDAFRAAGLRIEQILAPFDSPVNYFPMTETQFTEFCTRPLSRLIGNSACSALFSQSHAVGRYLRRMLVKMLNARNNTPGRLFSFVATKPERPLS